LEIYLRSIKFRKKTQKGFFVTALTTLLIQFFPDFPKEDWSKVVEFCIATLNAAATIWGSLGVLHQWVKDRILAAGTIPQSIKKLAEEGKKVLIVKPG
jgi:hypothetical protein